MLLDRLKFTKTLKFKITIWYSLLLSVFSIVLVLSMNIWLSNYMRTNVVTPNHGYWGRMMQDRPAFRNLSEQQIELIMESRLADLNNIRIITLYSIAPLVLLSFVGGYSIASLGLRPLEDLNDQMKNKSTENLGEEIEFDDKGDEISQLIKSFNRMSRRLNKSFESQKEFVENASHELKTPLAIIQANLDTALEDGNLNKEELEELLNSSRESIKFMDKLTEDLLLLSILENKVATEKVNVNIIIKQSVQDLKKSVDKKKIKIKKAFSSSEIYVQGNATLLQRAIMNILENAIKYSDCSLININVKEGKTSVEITIQDNGKGISKEHTDKVFERFYRIDRSRSRSVGGSGLGLAITKEIIEAYNGQIKLQTKGQKGSRFIITLPLS